MCALAFVHLMPMDFLPGNLCFMPAVKEEIQGKPCKTGSIGLNVLPLVRIISTSRPECSNSIVHGKWSKGVIRSTLGSSPGGKAT